MNEMNNDYNFCAPAQVFDEFFALSYIYYNDYKNSIFSNNPANLIKNLGG